MATAAGKDGGSIPSLAVLAVLAVVTVARGLAKVPNHVVFDGVDGCCS